MKNNCIFLNSKTFEIENVKDVISVDEQLAKTLSILNKKGYYTEMYSRAKIIEPFLIGIIINSFIEEGLLSINSQTRNIIAKAIRKADYEETLIVFKENYNFDTLPNGFKMNGKDLFYNLSIMKHSEEIELKTLIELDSEHNESIKNLEEWAIKLPKREN